jgi:hypothetical protein
MTFELNLDGVEPWKSGGLILRSGTHPVKVVEEEIDTTGDHPVVKVQMVAIGGEEKDAEIRDWIHVTKNSLGRIAQIYEAFGVEVPSGAFKWIPLKGRQAKIVVREEPKRDDPDRMVSVVKGYSALSASDAIGEAATALGASPVEDDDIPF